MKITILDMDNLKNPHWGSGQAKTTWEIARRLAQRHRITVYCSRYPGCCDYEEEGVSYKHIGLGSNNSKMNNLAYIFYLSLLVPRLRADIIMENFTAPVTTAFTPLFTRIPVVGLSVFLFARELSKKYHLPFHRVQDFGLKFYKYLIGLNDDQQVYFKKINPRTHSTVIYEGVGKEFFSIRRKTAKHILFVGRFDIHHKGIDLLLKAYAKIVDKIGYPFIIAGHGSDEIKIKRQITKLHLTDHVQIKDPIYGEEKEKILSQSLCVALPSRFETFSLFALEALAAGLPIVAFDIPGLSWNSGRGIVLKAKKFDTEEYSKLLLETTNKKLNEAMSRKARIFARQYTWSKVAKQYESFFYEVLENEKRYA